LSQVLFVLSLKLLTVKLGVNSAR